MQFISFIKFGLKQSLSGSSRFWIWISLLAFFISMGFFTFLVQLREGLVMTGMSDQVTWGFYVSNFTYLVGVAAAAVMLVIPAYIFGHGGAKRAVIIAEGLAVSACVMAILFVTVDLGHPERVWHLMPVIGKIHWPESLLAWDVLVVSGYLGLNLFIPGYILFHKYHGREYNKKFVFLMALISIGWAVSLHVVTAFLFSSNMSRPFWNSALTAPRFLASAFTSGPACIIIAFMAMRKLKIVEIEERVCDLLALIVTVSMQINLVMLVSEFFIEFYNDVSHAASAHYLFTGLNGHNTLVPWIWTAITLNVTAAILFMIKRFRTNDKWLFIASSFAVVGVWIEKGMGFVIPGFIPTPLGEIVEYMPTWPEIQITIGIYATGLLIFTIVTRAIIAINKRAEAA